MQADHRRLDTVSTHTWSSPAPAQGAGRSDLSGSTVGRFLIHERLGVGGMGEVYRAEDTQLKRTVAIKRLIRTDDNQSSPARLLREAQRASALNHPLIASVYDVFATADELLLVMEYIDGMTLRERMKRPITVPEFCTMALQCTEALSAAHDKGILHGDLKPANIMLTRQGEIKVCDFGLARQLPTGDATGETSTSHAIGGTPGYLAPEAVLGQPIDERADLFSLGIVFYQMLAARHPLVGETVLDTADRILHHTPEPLERINPHVPIKLARTVERMLAKDPDDRFANAAAVGEVLSSITEQDLLAKRRRVRLRRLRTAVVLAGAAIVGVVTVPRPAIPLPQRINLTVLPFVVTGTADDDRQRFTAGLGESVNDQLSRLTVSRKIQVATAADRRVRNVTNASEARQQLGANVALAGQLQYTGRDVRVLTTLLDTASGRPLRGETFTAAIGETLSVQARVVEAAMRMLGIDPDPNERMLLNVHTMQPGAYEFYLQARGYLLNYDRIESVDSAIAVFRKALEVERRYALAYAGLGQAFWRKYELTGSANLVEPARGSCESALGIDPTIAEPHACLGMVLNGTGEYEKATEEYTLALSQEPTNDQAYIGLATAYERLGKHAQAEETYRRAIALRPHYWGGYNNLGGYYYRLARYKDARDMFTQVVDLAPDSFRGHSSLGACEFALDHTAEAIAAFKKSLSIRTNFAAASNLGTLYYFQGSYRAAADLFRQARDLERGNYLVWGNLAQTLEHIGERADATAAFRQARTLALEQLNVNPRNASVHLEIADYNAALGDADAAKRELGEALKLAPDDAQTLFRIAVIYEYRLKARDEALNWLARAVERGQTWGEIDRAPDLRQLRTDPRFEQLRRSR
jgi:tetratricopeptide (TPR) repeat protein